MTKTWIRHFGPWLFALVVITGACNGSRDGFGDPGLTFAGDASSDALCATPGKTCSLDLHSVVDGCDPSNVITVCPPDQGCANGACVAACDASVSSSSSVGCEFVAIRPAYSNVAADPANVQEDGCFAAFVVNTWGSPLDVTAEHAGAAIDVTRSGRIIRSAGGVVTYDPFTGTLAPNEAAVLFLEHKPNAKSPCPPGIEPAGLENTSLTGTARGTSSTYWIKTSAPVGAYSIYPFGGASSFVASATLLLPVAAWKSDYILSDSWSYSTFYGTELANPTIQVVAQEDDTVVTLVGGVAVQPGISVAGAAQGVPQTYQLQRGELLQFSQKEELAGSLLSSNKSVAVWGGHECMYTGACCCDQSTRQLLPLQSWGDEYVAVPYLSRRADKLPETYPYRIGAAADGTILTYEPAPPPNAPLTLAKGAAVQFTTTTPFTVRSQDGNHAIALYEYMTGAATGMAADGDGDPEFSFVVPAKQYLNNYIFFVDPTYRNSQLVVVRALPEGGGGFQPVTLDCAGPLDEWTPVGTTGRYEYTRLALVRGFLEQEIGTGSCGAGAHSITSNAPFGVTVWGTDAYASYGYPGGAGIRTLNNVTATVH